MEPDRETPLSHKSGQNNGQFLTGFQDIASSCAMFPVVSGTDKWENLLQEGK
jgi:hypothetical protein